MSNMNKCNECEDCSSCYDTSQCKYKEGNTFKITMNFKRENLLYDIANVAYIEGAIQKKESEHDAHFTMDIVQDDNVDRITRILDRMYVQCVKVLSPYTDECISEDVELNDDFEETDTYTIVMNVSKKFLKPYARLIKTLIHEYMVSTSLFEWLAITKPNSAEFWYNKAEETLQEIRSALNTSSGVFERPTSPI